MASSDTGGLGLATARVLGGVLAHVFFAIGTRHFGAGEFAGGGPGGPNRGSR